MPPVIQMPRLPVPVPATVMVPLEVNPPGDEIEAALVSISTAMPASTPLLVSVPLLSRKLSELMVAAAWPLVPDAMAPVGAMVMWPDGGV